MITTLTMKLMAVFLIFTLSYTKSYKILVVYPFSQKSLNILGGAVVRHLLNDGHEVTYITTHPLDRPQSKNFRQIDVSSNKAIFYRHDNIQFSIGYVLENNIKENNARLFQELTRENARLTFQNENVNTFLKNPEVKFDVVIADLLESEVYAGLAVLYNCPMIWLYSQGPQWQVLRLTGEGVIPAYGSNYIGSDIPPFTFLQRVKEFWARLKWMYYKTFLTTPVERDIYKQTFEPLLKKQNRKLPDYADVIYNSSLIFGNEHHAVYFRPSTPSNFKYIGGFHIEDPVEPLPEDLKNIMDGSVNGVIYFSMGTFWRSKELPTSLTRALVNVFAKLKQTVIWKYEDELNDLPTNLHLVKWAPQQSILAHPKCKMFITHGGLLSTTEAIHFGVPIIGIPVLYDQFVNINRASHHGYGIRVNLNYNVPKNLEEAINIMLTDMRYTNKAKYLSSVYHDRPVKPGAELVHWVRHVVNTGGASHLKPAATKVPFYQRFYLDLTALMIIICLCFTYILRAITKKIINYLINCYKKSSQKKKQ